MQAEAALLRALHADLAFPFALEQLAVEAAGDVEIAVHVDAVERLVVAVPAVAAADQRLVVADLAHEAEVRAEARVDVLVPGVEVPVAVAERVLGAPRVARRPRVVAELVLVGIDDRCRILGLAVQDLGGGGVRALLPARVHAGDVVAVVVALAEGADRADAEVRVEVVAVAADGDVRLLVELLEARAEHARHQHQRGGVARDDRAVGAAAGAAGHAQAEVGIGDLAGVEHVELAGEVVRALEEERPLLLVEQGEAVVEAELQLVGLDLGKVGIDRGVERHRRRRRPAHVEAGLDRGVPALPGFAGGVAGLRAAHRQRRHDLEVAALVRAGEAVVLAPFALEAVGFARHAAAGQLVALVARPVAEQRDAPALLAAAGGEAQGGERDAELDVVAFRRDAARALPQAIPARILLVAAVALVADDVALHAERVRHQLVAAAVVVEGVEEDADPVVVEHRVAVAQVGADPRRVRIGRVERHVQRVGGVADADGGLHRRRDVVAGLDLVGDLLDERALPGRVVELAVDHDAVRQLRDPAAGHVARRRRGGGVLGPGLGERCAEQEGSGQRCDRDVRLHWGFPWGIRGRDAWRGPPVAMTNGRAAVRRRWPRTMRSRPPEQECRKSG